MKLDIFILDKIETSFKYKSENRILSNKRCRTYAKDDAQLLLLTGVFLCVAIVALASVMSSLANIDISIDKTSFIKSDYDNLRKEFGIALKDRLGGKLNYGETLTLIYFNETRDIFAFFVGTLNGNYFDADYKGLTYTNNEPDGIICFLKLGNGNEYVSEVINYDIY